MHPERCSKQIYSTKQSFRSVSNSLYSVNALTDEIGVFTDENGLFTENDEFLDGMRNKKARQQLADGLYSMFVFY